VGGCRNPTRGEWWASAAKTPSVYGLVLIVSQLEHALGKTSLDRCAYFCYALPARQQLWHPLQTDGRCLTGVRADVILTCSMNNEKVDIISKCGDCDFGRDFEEHPQKGLELYWQAGHIHCPK
jgi:hypothetical protein